MHIIHLIEMRENMKQRYYFKLAFTNIRKNKNAFFPFLLSTIIMSAMFYMLFSISLQSDGVYYGASYMKDILMMGNRISGIVSTIIIFYTNTFLMKQRSQELGLYNVLGMEKKHIAKVVTWETAVIAFLGTALGLLSGIIFAKFLFLVLIRMVRLSPEFSFSVSGKGISATIIVFVAIFTAIIFWNLVKIARLKPVEMMRETHAGEREPKAKWLLAFLGTASLAAGYFIAITTENPLEALTMFFVAVLLVIAGTYFLFTAGSIVLLKLLKKNKDFYYHKTHFVTVSGMMYRMKQNALGLASICILVTMVIVVLSTTVSLYIGIDDEQRYRYPKDVSISLDCAGKTEEQAQALQTKTKKAAQKRTAEKNVTSKEESAYYEYSLLLCQDQDNANSFMTQPQTDYTAQDLLSLTIMLCSEYNQMAGEQISLSGNTPALLGDSKIEFTGDSILIDGKKIACHNQGKVEESLENSLYHTAYLLVPDYNALCDMQKFLAYEPTRGSMGKIMLNYSFNLDGAWEDKEAYGDGLQTYLKESGVESIYWAEDYYSSYQSSLALYASVLFIGIFIGSLFLIATVLIIYYKQISEGYEDRRNFQIMRKIGLARKEISQIINSQIRMVFLLPIAMAVLHICFAFPIIKRIMAMLNLTNTRLFVTCTAGTVLAFFFIYVLVYKITSKVYYRIVGDV